MKNSIQSKKKSFHAKNYQAAIEMPDVNSLCSLKPNKLRVFLTRGKKTVHLFPCMCLKKLLISLL